MSLRTSFMRPLLLGLLALALGSPVPPADAAPTKKKPVASKTSKKKPSSKRASAAPTPKRPVAVAAGSDAAPGMQAATLLNAKASASDAAAAAAAAALKAAGAPPRSLPDLINAAPPEVWREPDSQNLVWMEFQLPGQPAGAKPAEVLMELAPKFAPQHAANIRALVRGGYFDGLAVLRVQDNFVTQWGDAGEGPAAKALPPGAQAKLPAEFDVPLAGLPMDALSELDGWSALNGFVDGFPVAADPAKTQQGRAWLVHCYGVVGAGRGNEIDSSNGSSLYAIIGQPARSLDLNITVVGRILKGIEHLAALPRGSGNMGFFGAQEAKPPLMRARLLADVPEAERPRVTVMRTDTREWAEVLHNRRNRSGWFVHSAGRVDLCSTSVPVRVTPRTPAP